MSTERDTTSNLPGTTGKKDDIGKLRVDLLPVGPIMKVAEVYTIGSRKYTDRNWELGIKWSRCYAAMFRHMLKWWGGEDYDQQDGQHHLSSVAFYCLALLEYSETHKELDDRPNKKATPPNGEVAQHLSTHKYYRTGIVGEGEGSYHNCYCPHKGCPVHKCELEKGYTGLPDATGHS